MWVLALKNQKGDFFAKGEPFKKHISLGCNHSHHEKAFHSYELMYDVSGECPGIMGSHAQLQWAGEYVLSPTITLQNRIKWANEASYDVQWKQKIDDKVSITFQDTINLYQAIYNPQKSNYNFGFKVQYSF